MIKLAPESEMGWIYESAKIYIKAEGVKKRSWHRWRKGDESPWYSDFDSAVNDPIRCEVFSSWYADQIRKIARERKIDLLAPIEKDKSGTIGVIRLSGVISILTGLPNVPVRLAKEIKSEKLKIPPVEGKPWKGRLNKSKMTILTDHCTTGSEVLKAVEAVEYNGGIVTDLIAYTYVPDKFDWNAFERKGIVCHFQCAIPEELEDTETSKNR